MGSYLDDFNLPPDDSDSGSDEGDESDDSECDGLAALGKLGPDTLCYRRCVVRSTHAGVTELAFVYSWCGGPELESTLLLPPLPAAVSPERTARLFAEAGLVALCWAWMATPATVFPSQRDTLKRLLA